MEKSTVLMDQIIDDLLLLQLMRSAKDNPEQWELVDYLLQQPEPIHPEPTPLI